MQRLLRRLALVAAISLLLAVPAQALSIMLMVPHYGHQLRLSLVMQETQLEVSYERGDDKEIVRRVSDKDRARIEGILGTKDFVRIPFKGDKICPAGPVWVIDREVAVCRQGPELTKLRDLAVYLGTIL